MAENVIDTSIHDDYTAAIRRMNDVTVTLPAVPSYYNSDSAVFSHLESVRQYDSAMRSGLNTVTDPTYKQPEWWDHAATLIDRCIQEAMAVRDLWEDRLTKLGHAGDAATYWERWNRHVRSFYLTDLVSAKKGSMMNVPYGDDEDTITNDHTYLNGMFKSVIEDRLYDDDGDGKENSSTSDVANQLLKETTDKAREKVRELSSTAKNNADYALETRSNIAAHVRDHTQAVEILNNLVNAAIYAQNSVWTIRQSLGDYQMPGGNDDVAGGAGS